ncbi:MAG: late competence development ComFB family protein [Cyanothece sp. SIO1E1]|nr:late competence development ComFB family protein [Cyanothece sp. SIO1E1]
MSTVRGIEEHSYPKRKLHFKDSPGYRNVLEPLVTEEVKRQLKKLSPKLLPYIHPSEAIAAALNRLPPLYATSEAGWHLQQHKAMQELKPQIVMAVRWGLNAVLQDPLKHVDFRRNLNSY